MDVHRRSSVARVAALLLSVAAAIVLVIDLAHPVTRLNVLAICLVVITAAAWLAWLFIHIHETALKTALTEDRMREQHAEQRLRGLRSNADSEH